MRTEGFGEGFAELRPALIAAGFLNMPAALFGFELRIETLLAGFLAAFAVYLADHRLPTRNLLLRPLLLLLSGAVLVAALLGAQLHVPGLLVYMLLACAYVLPCPPGGKRLQDLPKPRFLAVVGGWACIPLLLKPFPLSGAGWLYVCGMAGFMIPALIWSDRADQSADLGAGRETWVGRFTDPQRRLLVSGALILSLGCFSPPALRPMLPGPLMYLLLFPLLERRPRHSDWILLWPLLGSLLWQFKS